MRRTVAKQISLIACKGRQYKMGSVNNQVDSMEDNGSGSFKLVQDRQPGSTTGPMLTTVVWFSDFGILF
jgi:hypothetical protein